MKFNDALEFYRNLRSKGIVTVPAQLSQAAPPNLQNFENAESVERAIQAGIEACMKILQANPKHSVVNALQAFEEGGK
jgi:hypothetical protein